MPLITIIDDRVTNRRILARLASRLADDVEVESFALPGQALDFIDKNTPDLIITDFKMPEMDGAEFIRRLRDREETAEVPVIVVSVYKDRDYRYEALTAGATDFLMSPVDHYEFIARAKNLLTLRRQQQLLKERALNLEDELRTKTKDHSKALRQSRTQLISVIDALPASVYAYDSRGRCLFINSYGASLCGTTPEEAAGQRIELLIGEDAWLKEREQEKALAASKTQSLTYETEIPAKSGPGRTFLTTKTLLTDPEDNAENILNVAFEITDRKAMEQEFRYAKEEAEQANRVKTRFLANMSHELRTPLNAIIGFSQTMQEEHLGALGHPKYNEYVEDILVSGRHLLNLISDMLDLARIDEDSISLDEETVSLGELLSGLVRIMSMEAGKKEIELNTRIPDDLPPVKADAQKIRQSVLNLLSNAIRYSRTGDNVELRASTGTDGTCKIEVRDTGPGMSAEQIEIAKSRFGRLHEDPAIQTDQGAGLGLPITIGLIELHGGTVTVLSEKNIGTRVILTLPASRVLADEDTGGRTSARSGQGNS